MILNPVEIEKETEIVTGQGECRLESKNVVGEGSVVSETRKKEREEKRNPARNHGLAPVLPEDGPLCRPESTEFACQNFPLTCKSL